MIGRLIGVGVGPGAPDLITLRAQRVLSQAHVVAVPRSSPRARSLAWQTCRQSYEPHPDQQRLFLHFPMTKDPKVLRPALERALDELAQPLQAGKDVAFITVGDPFTYSTFIYVRAQALVRWPELEVEVVPGVTSLTAVPAAAGVPLADGQERIAVLPATYGIDDLSDCLRRFDTTLLLKVGRKLPEVVDALRSEGLLDRSVYVSRATTGEERIERDLARISGEGPCDYFSMVVVARRDRAGVITGDAPAAGVRT